MAFQKTIVALLGVFAFANAQIIVDGDCNVVTTQKNFNAADYLGTWYEIQRYEMIFQKDGECSTAEYSLFENGTVRVHNSMVLRGKWEDIYGYADEANPELKDGKLKVSFPTVGNYNSDYWVLETDYEHYSVVWSCTQIMNKNLQFAWVLSRTKVLDAKYMDIVNAVLDRNQVNKEKFRVTKQDDETCQI